VEGAKGIGGDDVAAPRGVTMKLRSDLMFAHCDFSSRQREKERGGTLVVRHNWQGSLT